MTRFELIELAEEALAPLFRKRDERRVAAQSVVDIVLLAPYGIGPGDRVQYQAKPGGRRHDARVMHAEDDGAICVFVDGRIRVARREQIKIATPGRGGKMVWRSLVG